MSERIFNFSAGPGVLPEPVIKQAQKDMWNLFDTGIGVMEHSHRGKAIDRVWKETMDDCRALAGIPDSYSILFLTGGATQQFFQVPANFLKKDQTADYINTGVWSTKAIKEAKNFGTVHVAASSEDRNFCYIPRPEAVKFSASPRYVHFTTNNTIYGTEWKAEPKSPAGVPVICDTSSDMFSRPIDVTKYALIYAGAQKNLGPAGVTLVIIRNDLMEQGSETIPQPMQYRAQAKEDSRLNTPPVFAVYMVGQVLKWIIGEGGLKAMAERNMAKAKPLYDYLDSSKFFKGTADKDSRSLMNVCFRAPSEDLETKFIKEAAAAKLDGLKGHRSVGGMRASIYNAFPAEGVTALVRFMEKFEKANS
jgi:phosphoserine aminotransferase